VKRGKAGTGGKVENNGTHSEGGGFRGIGREKSRKRKSWRGVGLFKGGYDEAGLGKNYRNAEKGRDCQIPSAAWKKKYRIISSCVKKKKD